MAEKPIIFALANPDPEITLDDALEGGAYIYGSGRSDFKNQINNSIVFPGIFRGIHEHDLPEITDDMKLFIAQLIADNIDRGPTPRHIIVDSLDLDMPVLISNGLKKFKTVKKPE